VRTLDRRHHALNWSGQSISDQLLLANPSTEAPAPVSNPTTWSVLPLERSIVGDFELSFDLLFNWIDPPGFPSMPACTLYVGLGTVPVLATESAPDGPGSAPSQSGVFAAMPWSGCVGKYLARPSVHARGAVYEDRNETFGDPYACLLERHLSSSKTRRMTLRREGNKVTVSVPRDDGCGIAERTITYSGAVPDLPALLVGSGGGDFAPCTLSHIDKTTVTFTNGSGTLSNVELRLLDDPGQCPGTEALCGKGSQEPACVDTKTSSEHCGACGHACGANEICTEGRCGEKPPPNITWLTFDDQGRARSDELGIDGVLYAAADPCVTATLEWDPRTRCTTGKLCEFGTDHRNFGLGLDFDFLRRGDTTLTFNPEEAGVRGIAWEISGHAPGLQVWMLNMDPKWNGECSGDWTAPVIPFCRMPGAPDGMPIAPLVGQLFFDAMVKDNWFTNGVRYTYDPRAVYGFEINLPTDTAPPKASFSFCVDRIGVIR
jgi:hypothetical protein